MEKTISENILRGIATVIHEHAPHLIPPLTTLIRAGEISRSHRAPGDSIYGTLSGTIPVGDGEAILKALLEAEKLHGPSALFGGVQINFLIGQWQDFADPLRLPR